MKENYISCVNLQHIIILGEIFYAVSANIPNFGTVVLYFFVVGTIGSLLYNKMISVCYIYELLINTTKYICFLTITYQNFIACINLRMGGGHGTIRRWFLLRSNTDMYWTFDVVFKPLNWRIDSEIDIGVFQFISWVYCV